LTDLVISLGGESYQKITKCFRSFFRI